MIVQELGVARHEIHVEPQLGVTCQFGQHVKRFAAPCPPAPRRAASVNARSLSDSVFAIGASSATGGHSAPLRQIVNVHQSATKVRTGNAAAGTPAVRDRAY